MILDRLLHLFRPAPAPDHMNEREAEAYRRGREDMAREVRGALTELLAGEQRVELHHLTPPSTTAPRSSAQRVP